MCVGGYHEGSGVSVSSFLVQTPSLPSCTLAVWGTLQGTGRGGRK